MAEPASVTEPHTWHSPQRPTHLEVCQPHSAQRYAGFAVFAFAMRRSVGVRADTPVRDTRAARVRAKLP
ncbi:hypothetical protein GCM10023085_52650 [Actinomadura viridis]